MKKVLISIGSLLMMALVVVMFVNAADSGKDKKKPVTEVKANANPAPCSATCGTPEGTAASKCQPANCNESADQTKANNCDPAACPEKKEAAAKESPACPAAASCAQTCQPRTNGKK